LAHGRSGGLDPAAVQDLLRQAARTGTGCEPGRRGAPLRYLNGPVIAKNPWILSFISRSRTVSVRTKVQSSA